MDWVAKKRQIRRKKTSKGSNRKGIYREREGGECGENECMLSIFHFKIAFSNQVKSQKVEFL